MFKNRNPFERYLTVEDRLQIAVNKFIKSLKVGNEGGHPLLLHVPNEGKRTPFQAYKFKILGGEKSWPDVMIFEKNGKWEGLAIELKADAKDYLKKNGSIRTFEHVRNQHNRLKELSRRGWFACFMHDPNEIFKLINTYFRNPDSLTLPNYMK